MPLRTAQRCRSIAAATGRSEVDRHAECTHHLQPCCTMPVQNRGADKSQAVSNSVSQTVASKHTKTSIPRHKHQPLFSSLQYEAYIGSGENDKRYRRQHPASCQTGQLASTYPYNSKQSISSSLRAIRLQQRCNLDSRRDVRTHIFHRICNLARPMETPLCKISF